MFDFENLIAYQKARILNQKIQGFIETHPKIRTHLRDQLSRASTSILLNIAEGSGKWSRRDKSNYYSQARGSSYECVSVLHILYDTNLIKANQYDEFYNAFEELSKILSGLIKSQSH